MALDQSALTQEVANLKAGHSELRADFRNLENKVDSGFAMLVQKLDAKTTPQWQPIAIAVTVLLFIGGVFISSIKEALTKNESALEIVRRENEARVVKLWDAENATARDLAYLQGQLHPLPPR
ncbi:MULTISPECIES: hypothetical protein [unclassified Bradyrhizobium]|uniref:hypothetical protein n=1 Tax=unclassified Bradyrhizobium TaxID=2631580 RepID=UPI002916343F|nr:MULTISPECIES: hypothetical protein [unclassified Bradyrhizobium]